MTVFLYPNEIKRLGGMDAAKRYFPGFEIVVIKPIPKVA